MAAMRFWIRTDSSVRIGGGHMMRCLALAEELRERGAQVIFLCADLPGNSSQLALAAGCRVEVLTNTEKVPVDGMERQDVDAAACGALVRPSTDDWLVVDHYGLDRHWESAMRGRFNRILAIDDLANRSHDCDMLLDQNRMRERANDYAALISPACQVLAGPAYALLARQFREYRRHETSRDGRLSKVMVSFGSSDEENHTLTALEGIMVWGKSVDVTVVIGASNPNRKAIEARCRSMPSVQLHVQTTEMARLTKEADCAIGAAGSATWERCCLGLPGLLAICAENQEIVAQTAAAQGVAHNIGQARELTPESVASRLADLSTGTLKEMEARARALVDGRGVVRLAEELL